MELHYNTLIGILLNISAMIIVVTMSTWLQVIARPSLVVRTLFAMTIISSFWCVGQILTIALPQLRIQGFFLAISYTGPIFVPPLCLLFALAFTENKMIYRPHIVFLTFLFPAVDFCFVLTNDIHRMFFVDIGVEGTLFWIHSAVCYVLLILALIIMVSNLIKKPSSLKVMLLAGIIIPSLTSVLYTFKVFNSPFSLSAVAFSVSMIIYIFAIYRYNFVSVTNIATRNVYEAISDVIFVTNANGQIIYANDNFPEIFAGISIEDKRTSVKTFLDYLITENYEIVPGDLYELHTKNSDKMLSGEINGKDRFFSFDITPLGNKKSGTSHLGSMFTISDVSSYKLLIEETKAKNKELIILKDAAESASKAKSTFLASMSHEMRTPLNAIIGMSSIGHDSTETEKKDYCFERIDSASYHLLGVINDVLDMSKIEAGKLELSRMDFSLSKMTARLEGVFTFRFEEKKQSFTILADSDLPDMINTDELRLSQVITNLISNAIKFTPESGKISLKIQNMGLYEKFYTLRFTVSDNGIGISPEQKEKLFRSFEQADNSISRRFGGTGLGLVISKQIVELMDGNIWIESEIGRGSDFIFEIKAAICQSLPGEKETDRESEQNEEDYTDIFKGKHLLLAEDMEINREIVISLLEFTGIEIDAAENGLQALKKFEEASELYDIILMDINMPELDGYEAARRIRGFDSPKAKKIPIVAMTANVFKEDIDHCFAAGMNDHISKPIDMNLMIQKLLHFLKQS